MLKGDPAPLSDLLTWDSPPPLALETEVVVSDIPTLILSGEFDPITPPAWGRLASETLQNSQFMEFPGVGPGVMGSGSDRGNCSIQVVDAFLEDPDSPVEAGCVESLQLVFKKK
jgi:pimeloyl-ACP methyl ester carboxylesterase